MTHATRRDVRNNWRTSEEHELGNGLVLTITTHKVSSGSIVTSASVLKREGGFMVHAMYQDFSKRLGIAQFRATPKAMGEHHDACIKDAGGLDSLIKEAKCHHRAELAVAA